MFAVTTPSEAGVAAEVRQGTAIVAAARVPHLVFSSVAGYQADVAALRRDYPAVRWISSAGWADHALGLGAAVIGTTT